MSAARTRGRFYQFIIFQSIHSVFNELCVAPMAVLCATSLAGRRPIDPFVSIINNMGNDPVGNPRACTYTRIFMYFAVFLFVLRARLYRGEGVGAGLKASAGSGRIDVGIQRGCCRNHEDIIAPSRRSALIHGRMAPLLLPPLVTQKNGHLNSNLVSM